MRFFYFKMSDNTDQLMTIQDALKVDDIEVKKRLQKLFHNLENKRRIKDGFTPGHQPNLGNRWVGGKREYAKILKEEGLVEAGYEYRAKESKGNINPCANEEFALEAKKYANLSDNEVDAIKSGEYFKD